MIKNKMIKLSLVLLILFTNITFVFSRSYSGEKEFVFLNMGTSARSMALGEAFVGVTDDVASLRYNPAGIRKMLYRELLFTHVGWFQGLRGDYIAFAQPLNSDFAFGVSCLYFTSDSIVGRDDRGYVTKELDFNQMIGTISLARVVSIYGKKSDFGLTVKYASEKYDDGKWDAYALDFGILSEYLDGALCFAAVCRNIPIGDTDLPIEYKLGARYLLRNNLSFTVDVAKYEGIDPRFAVGAEYTIYRMLSIRCGYKTLDNSLGESEQLEDLEFINSTGLCFGLGIITNPVTTLSGARLRLDYGFVNFGDLGLTHLVSVTMRF